MEKLFTNEWKKSSHVYLSLNIVPLADKVPIEKQNKTYPNLIILYVQIILSLNYFFTNPNSIILTNTSLKPWRCPS